MKIILASNSPRRRELMKRILNDFLMEDSNFEESSVPKMSPKKLAERLSFCKADAVYKRHSDSLVIAADTIVVLGSRILGKPKSTEEAVTMLMSLSGRVHKVITAFTIMSSKKSVTRSVETKVFMRRFTDEEAASYVRTGEPMDKAGAYGIQGMGGLLIDKIDGDYYNVVGLPLTALLVELRKFGISV
jgi:septum formation protein